MATATVHAVLPDPRADIWADLARILVVGKLTIDAGPATYITNGLPIGPGLGNELIKSQKLPIFMLTYSNTTPGNVYAFDIVNNSLRIFVAGVELATAAAIPVGISGDSINFFAIFLKGV